MGNREGIGYKCAICSKIITEEDFDEENNNPAMRMMGIPGWIHRKCKKDTESFLINSSTHYEELKDG